MYDRLFLDVRLATMNPAVGAPYGEIEAGAVATADGRIAWVGERSALEAAPESLAGEVVSLNGALMTPALVDCHTHLVFAGDRSGEYEMRLNGASYEEIARAGGGILSTVEATRAASLDDLTALAAARMEQMLRAGVATVEFKSGYGLNTEAELKMLEAGTRAAELLGLRVRRSFLAMHALPPEFKDDRAGYVRLVCEEMLPEAKKRGLVDAVDAYCEGIGFTAEEVRTLFETSKKLGLPVKLHAEQLSDLGGAGLAAGFQALSADHLEYVNENDIEAMAKAGSVAVLLPGAYYFLKDKTPPPVSLFRKHGVAMAVASDLNPGTSPVLSPGLMMNMATTLFGLTPEEALAGMTRQGARALGLEQQTGMLKQGLAADLAVWDVRSPAELAYWIGGPGPAKLYRNGVEEPRL